MMCIAHALSVSLYLLAQDPAPSTPPPSAPAPATTTPAPAPAPAAKPRLYVPPVTAFGIPAELTAVINDAVATEASQSPSHQTLTEADLAQLLSVEQRKQAAGCADASCFTDLGKLVNADRVLSCSAGLQGDDVNISCKLLGVREGSTLASKDRKVVAKSAAAADTARAIVGILLDGQARDRRGTVELKVSQPGAEVFIDGRSVGTSPMKEPLRLDEGKREIVIKRSGHAPWRTTIDVQSGTFTTVDAQLVATRSVALWPMGVGAFVVGGVLASGALLAGAASGGVADCLYYGSLREELPGNPLGFTSSVCSAGVNYSDASGQQQRIGLPQPAYKDRPIYGDQFNDRQSQVITAAVVANIFFGATAVLMVLAAGVGLALVVTDVIIRTARREE